MTFTNGDTATPDALVGCDGVASSVRPSLARYEAARKQRANGAQVLTRERAEVLMSFEDDEAMPMRDSAGWQTYDPATVPV